MSYSAGGSSNSSSGTSSSSSSSSSHIKSNSAFSSPQRMNDRSPEKSLKHMSPIMLDLLQKKKIPPEQLGFDPEGDDIESFIQHGNRERTASKGYGRPENTELRILICTATYFVLDGVTLTIRRLESYLKSQGAIVKILSTVPDDATSEEVKDIIIVPGINIPFGGHTGYKFGSGLDEATLAAIESFAPNCVHFTVPDLVGTEGMKWCQKNNIPYMATWHSNYTDYVSYYDVCGILSTFFTPGFERYLKGFYEQMPNLYVPSAYMKEKMTNKGYGLCTEMKVWGRGVDMSLFSPDRRSSEFRRSRGIAESDILILWVGRLVPEKRPDIWMNTLKRLQKEHGSKVKGIVVGAGEASLQNVLQGVAMSAGWLSGVSLAEAYASSDILLFPSAVETFGNVTLEALASGCVCVVEELCGKHLIDHGDNGFCCTAGDQEAFYRATKTLVEDKLGRQRMALCARQGAWKFERSKILQMMAENYKDAIVKHQDPTFIKRHLIMAAPDSSTRSYISILCCNYRLAKLLASPVLNSAASMSHMATASTECVGTTRSRFSQSCANFSSLDEEKYDEQSARFDDEGKVRLTLRGRIMQCLSKSFHYLAFVCFVVFLFMFIYASFVI